MRTFCPHLGSFLGGGGFFSLRFGQISLLAFFRWLTATLYRNPEFCNRIPSDYKTQHSYTRSRLITWRRPEVKFDRNVVRRIKKKSKKKHQDEDKKSAINKLILRLRSLISKGFPIKTKWILLGFINNQTLQLWNSVTEKKKFEFRFKIYLYRGPFIFGLLFIFFHFDDLDLVWLGWVLGHFNPRSLFNVKSCP